MRICLDVILNRPLRLPARHACVLAMAALLCVSAVGCGTNANGDFRDFADTATAGADSTTPGESTADVADSEPASETPAVTDVVDGDSPDVATTGFEATTVNTTEQSTRNAADEVLVEPGTRDEIPVVAREIELLIPQKSFNKDRKTQAIRVSYDDIDLLKILNMEPVPTNAVDHFPDWLKGLNGKEIRIRGFMYPTYKSTGLTGFLLARDNGICCFVRQAKIYDLFVVKLADGQTSDYIPDVPFDVVGTFHIDPLVEDDELLHLYRIDEARVIAK